MTKRQMTVGRLIRQLMKLPQGALVAVPTEEDRLPQNLEKVDVYSFRGEGSQEAYDFQNVDGKRPGRTIVVLR
jgi:hypothetical protein